MLGGSEDMSQVKAIGTVSAKKKILILLMVHFYWATMLRLVLCYRKVENKI